MSAFLCPLITPAFVDAENKNKFFNSVEAKIIEQLELREQPPIGVPGKSCITNLFFGFFFDGTKNNYVLAEQGKCHSNVARLYDCYPGLSVPGVLPASTDWKYQPQNFTHFFKTYIPGVASPFRQINDSGAGIEGTRGAATGYGGQARIVWALLQAINNVHRYFLKSPLISASEALSIISRIELNKANLGAMGPDIVGSIPDRTKKTRNEFAAILKRLHAAVSQHWPDKSTGRPQKIDPGTVKTIHVSIFGFFAWSNPGTRLRHLAHRTLSIGCESVPEDGHTNLGWL
jgi:hypothetical protein